jgi:hypothetical protein
LRSPDIMDIIIHWAQKVEFLAPLLLGILFIFAIYLVWRYARQIRRFIHGIRVDDGQSKRELTEEKRFQLAYQLAWKRGRSFWPLVGAGVVLAATALAIVWKLGLL